MEGLYELWAKRNPQWELKYEELINTFTDYGKGVNQYQDVRGKVFGAGYEIYIIAFFIGLYFNKVKPIVADSSKRKGFGQIIQYWGNIEARNFRIPYPQIKEYIFAALVARTDVDLIGLDKGEISAKKIVDELIDKMEGYANYGFSYMSQTMEDNPDFFFKDGAFLKLFLPFMTINEAEEDEGPESLA